MSDEDETSIGYDLSVNIPPFLYLSLSYSLSLAVFIVSSEYLLTWKSICLFRQGAALRTFRLLQQAL
jgi:hypothetical protein